MHHSDRGAQYLSIRYTERLEDVGIEPSVGSVGDSYDNALAESIIGLHKTEVIEHLGPWRGREHVEFERLDWVSWFNKERLFGPIGDVPPGEFEAEYAIRNQAAAAFLVHGSWPHGEAGGCDMADEEWQSRRRFLMAAGGAGVAGAAMLTCTHETLLSDTHPPPEEGDEVEDTVFNVREFGAVPDALEAPSTGGAAPTNNRAAFQTALDAARDAGGGVVLVPAGYYAIDTSEGGSLQVHDGCGIRGIGGWQTRGLDDPLEAPALQGPTLVITDQDRALLELHQGILLKNLCFFWPGQTLDRANDPIPYEPALVAEKVSGVLRDLVFYNAYRVADFDSAQRLNLLNIQASVAQCFLRVRRGLTPCFLNNIWVSGAVWPAARGPNDPKPHLDYSQENCTVIDLEGWEGLRVDGLTAFMCKTFIKKTGEVEQKKALCVNVVLDSVPEILKATNPGSSDTYGVGNILFSNSVFVCNKYPSSPDPEAVGGTEDAIALTYDSNRNQHDSITFTGCIFRSSVHRFLNAVATGPAGGAMRHVRFDGCWFYDWGVSSDLEGGPTPAIEIDSPGLNLDVQGCTFVARDRDQQPMGIRALRYRVLRITDCTFTGCWRALSIGNTAPQEEYSGEALVLSGNVSLETTSAIPFNLIKRASRQCVANNLFDADPGDDCA